MGGWADRVDRRRAGRGRGDTPGAIAVSWATVKFVLTAPVTPIGFAIVGWRAIINHEQAKRTMAALPGLLVAIAKREPTPAEFGVVTRLDATEPLVITSDLHRCIAGRLDLVGHQDNRALDEAMLDWDADAGFGLRPRPPGRCRAARPAGRQAASGHLPSPFPPHRREPRRSLRSDRRPL